MGAVCVRRSGPSSRTGISPIGLTVALRRARDAAAEVGPDRLEGLTAQSEHQRQLVAVPRFGKIVQPVAGHAATIERVPALHDQVLLLLPRGNLAPVL